jgi:hypothetical protein
LSKATERLAKLQARLDGLSEGITVVLAEWATRKGHPSVIHIVPRGAVAPSEPAAAQSAAAAPDATSTTQVMRAPRPRRRRAV